MALIHEKKKSNLKQVLLDRGKHYTCSCKLLAIAINVVFFDVLASSRSMASKTPVGFIGLGNMGNPMAKNLLKHGYPVIATDVFPESCKEVQELGAQVSQ